MNVLAVVAGVIWCFASSSLATDLGCSQQRIEAGSDTAFNAFSEQVLPCWRLQRANTTRAKLMHTITSDGLRALMPKGTKPQCLALLYMTPDDKLQVTTILSTSSVCDRTVHRMQAVRIALQDIWQRMAQKKNVGKGFRAWFDFSAGSVLTSEMYEYLHWPVLTPGRGAQDACSFPVPHVYSYYAMVGSNIDSLYAFARKAPAPEVTFALEMFNVLSEHGDLAAQVSEWEHKRPVAVYRGSCFPTANPDPTGPGYLFLRGALCSKAAEVNAEYLDVGTSIQANYVQDAHTPYCTGPFFGTLCESCAACNTSGKLTRAEMLDYKYQVSVEGYGPTADAFLWKLKSNSVVMHIVPENAGRQPYYVAWFWPLLQADTHFMPVTLDELPGAVRRCLNDDGLCKQIATNALDISKCELSLTAQASYLTKVMLLLQSLEGPAAEDTKGIHARPATA